MKGRPVSEGGIKESRKTAKGEGSLYLEKAAGKPKRGA